MKTIGICADHAGFYIKEFVKQLLEKKGVVYKDLGTYSGESCDYADFAHLLAKAIEDGDVDAGIAVCGSGNGINMTLNKHQHIRSALCWNEETARLSRAHNDANVLAMPGRFLSENEVEKMVETFLVTPFDGGRHANRVKKVALC